MNQIISKNTTIVNATDVVSEGLITRDELAQMLSDKTGDLYPELRRIPTEDFARFIKEQRVLIARTLSTDFNLQGMIRCEDRDEGCVEFGGIWSQSSGIGPELLSMALSIWREEAQFLVTQQENIKMLKLAKKFGFESFFDQASAIRSKFWSAAGLCINKDKEDESNSIGRVLLFKQVAKEVRESAPKVVPVEVLS